LTKLPLFLPLVPKGGEVWEDKFPKPAYEAKLFKTMFIANYCSFNIIDINLKCHV